MAITQHGKGNKRGFAKLPVEVKQTIDSYLEAVGRTEADPEAPLFVGFRKGDHPQKMPISGTLIERVLKQRAKAIDVTMSPHGMRLASLPWPSREALISRRCRMPPGKRTRERRGAIRSGGRASIRMPSILSGFEQRCAKKKCSFLYCTKCRKKVNGCCMYS